MEEQKLISLLQEYLEDFNRPAQITDGYNFDMKETVNKIELYRASKFKSGDRDAQGNKKYFFNIVNPQCGNATKNIDLDRNNVRIMATESADDKNKAILYNAELKYWMRKNNIGLLMNRVSEFLPAYGSIILKKVGDKIRLVPLRKIKIDPAVSNKEYTYDVQSPYVVEELNFQPDELEKMIEQGWDSKAVHDVADSYREARRASEISDITVYEFHGEFKKSEIGAGTTGWTKAVVYIAFGFALRNGQVKDYRRVLYAKPEKTFNYKKLDYFTIEGRALGLGITEMLFDPQQRWNEMANQKALSMKISSKHLFQTRDSMVEKNVLSDLLDGDIMKVNAEITPIVTEERNLAAYSQEERNIMEVSRANSQAFEMLTGEGLPSGTPYRLGVLLNQNGGKLFEFLREQIGLFWEEVFKEWIIPEFEKQRNAEHMFELLDSTSIKLIYEADVNERVNEAIKKMVLAGGLWPTQDEIDMVKEQELSKPIESLFVKVPKGHYDFDKEFVIDMTGEQVNAAARIETINNLLQLLAQNPQITTLPTTKGLFEDLLDQVGVGRNRIGTAQQPALNQMPAAAAAGMTGNVPLANAGA